ncbi:EpsG family protein [uncultured Ilyobacter sp.]|uniref:EpsG family protein n=1 Tax=uncultured Ilyobacter sp. TaxID=544433 RepID=UPI0029C02931|nr:EpsG family protein [uncultured Ilyobacter sp.]
MSIVVYIIALGLSAISLIEINRLKNGFYILLFTYLILIAGFRYNVGTDFWRYESAYLKEYIWFPELGLKYLISGLRYLSVPTQGFFLMTAFIIQYLIFRFLKKNSRYFYWSVFLYITFYYYNHSLNLIRQFIAMAIFLYAIECILEKKFFKYNIFMFLVSLFHQSALVFYPIYFLSKLKIKRRIKMYILTLSFLLMFVKFDKIVIEILKKIGGRFAYYATWGVEKYLKYDLSWEIVSVLFLKFLMIFWLTKNLRDSILNKNEKTLYNIYFLTSCISFVLYPMLIFRRLLFYTNILEIIILPLFYNGSVKKRVVLISYALFYYFAHLLSGFSNPLPYILNV